MDILVKAILVVVLSLGIPGLVIAFIFFYPEKLKLIQASITQFFGKFSFWARKSTIKNRVEGSCDSALKEFHKEMKDISIPTLVIEWVNGDDFETRVKDDEAVVLLRFSRNDTANIVKATTAYVRDAFLVHTKPYLSQSLRKSLDLSVIRYVLQRIRSNSKSALSRFVTEYAYDMKENQPVINKIESINDAGLFTRLMIRELDGYGNLLIGRTPDVEYEKEADDFLDYLYEIATRDPDDYTQLAFVRPDIKVGVLLVAKKETYYNHGLKPYLNRIKKGFAFGVNTFYLLAREDKIEILDEVFKGLLQTGNFNLLQKPREFDDRQGREVKCYCITIDKESSLTRAYEEINTAMSNGDELEAIITNIRTDRVTVDYNGIKGYVYKHNFSNSQISSPTDYFVNDTYVFVKPIEINGEGDVEFSIAGTKSDPITAFSAYKIGMEIEAKVKYVDDAFIKFQVPNSLTTGIALRNDLTYSRFLLLYKRFQIDEVIRMTIKALEPDNNNLILGLPTLIDPWLNIQVKKGDKVRFEVCKRENDALVGEIQEGITAFLKKRDLSWDENNNENVRKGIHLGDFLECTVSEVNLNNRLVYVTLRKPQDNPYKLFCQQYQGKDVEAMVETIDEFGIHGKIGQLRLFVPNRETFRGKNHFDCHPGIKVKVRIKEISERGDSIIGSFLPFIPYPLESFSQSYPKGTIIRNLKPSKSNKQFVQYLLTYADEEYRLTMNVKDVANDGFVDDLTCLYNNIQSMPLAVKDIDVERNRVYLSLSCFTNKNSVDNNTFQFGFEYEGIVLSRTRDGYKVLIPDKWIEVFLNSHKRYNTGAKVRIILERLTSPMSFIDEF